MAIVGWGNTDKEIKAALDYDAKMRELEQMKEYRESYLEAMQNKGSTPTRDNRIRNWGWQDQKKAELAGQVQSGTELGAATSYGGQGSLTPAEIAASRQAGGFGQPIEVLRGGRGTFAATPGAGGEYLTMGQARQAIRRDISGRPTGEVTPEMAQEGERGRFNYPYVSVEKQKAIDTGQEAWRKGLEAELLSKAEERETKIRGAERDVFTKDFGKLSERFLDKEQKLPPFVNEVLADSLSRIQNPGDAQKALAEATQKLGDLGRLSDVAYRTEMLKALGQDVGRAKEPLGLNNLSGWLSTESDYRKKLSRVPGDIGALHGTVGEYRSTMPVAAGKAPQAQAMTDDIRQYITPEVAESWKPSAVEKALSYPYGSFKESWQAVSRPFKQAATEMTSAPSSNNLMNVAGAKEKAIINWAKENPGSKWTKEMEDSFNASMKGEPGSFPDEWAKFIERYGFR